MGELADTIDKGQDKAGLPLWSQLLIGLVMVSYMTLFCGGIFLIRKSRDLAIQSLDPRNVAIVAKKIAVFPEPLPRGYAYKFGLYLWPISFLIVEHSPDQQQILFICSFRAQETDPKDLLKQACAASVNTTSTSATFKRATKEGQILIGGEKVPYIQAELIDNSHGQSEHSSLEGLIACVVVKAKQKNIIIYALQPSAGQFNSQEVLDFLRSIRQF